MIDDNSTQRAPHDNWMHYNRVYLKVMQYTIDKTIKQSIFDTPNAKAFMDFIVEKFVMFNKAKKGC